MTDTVFQQAAKVDTSESNQDNAGKTDATKHEPKLEDFVGEGKKYATEQEALASLPYAQEHIKKLEADNAKLAAELAKAKLAEELLAELKGGSTTDSDTAQSSADASTDDKSVSQNAQNTASDSSGDNLESKVAEIVQKLKQTEEAKNNYAKFESELFKLYGENSATELKKLSERTGLSLNDLQDLAQRSPNAVLTMLDKSGNSNSGTPAADVTASVTSDAFKNVAPEGGKRTFAYYEKIRKNNPDLYWTQEVQTAMHKDAATVEGFYSQ